VLDRGALPAGVSSTRLVMLVSPPYSWRLAGQPGGENLMARWGMGGGGGEQSQLVACCSEKSKSVIKIER
jgi:hypothetical protein